MLRDTGISANGDMTTCLNRHNSTTYLQCPIENNIEAESAVIAVHNPRSQSSSLVSFLVPPEWVSASVEVWNEMEGAFVQVEH